MMYDELYQYLIQQKELGIPGIGIFTIQRKPAEADFVNKCIHPPAYEIKLDQTTVIPPKKMFTWLADIFNISDREAVIRFNDFAFDLKKKITDGEEVQWSGIGKFSKGVTAIHFTPVEPWNEEGDVAAQKIIREHAEHIVLVGERERTSVEMTELLNQQDGKKKNWWAYALAIGILAIIFIFWYFSEHGMQITSTANSQNLPVNSEPPTYSISQ